MVLKRSLFAAMALSVLLPALAEARPDLRNLSCAKAQQMVARSGSVVFTTGRHTYSRFVAGPQYCDPWEAAFVQYARTRDAARCPVAYECKEPLFRRRGLFWD